MDVVNSGAMGFWFFLAAVVVAGMWFDAKKRESVQETLRRVVESGQNIDPAVVDKLIGAADSSDSTDRELVVGGLIVLFTAPGLTILGWFLSKFNEKIFDVMLGVSLLVACIGVGLLVAAKYSARQKKDNSV